MECGNPLKMILKRLFPEKREFLIQAKFRGHFHRKNSGFAEMEYEKLA